MRFTDLYSGWIKYSTVDLCSYRECKRQMSLIIERGQGSQPMGGGGGSMDGGMGEGNTVVEMNIPGSKVGLIIGKGGETIRQLQVSCSL